MSNEIKDLIDNIINNTDSSYPSPKNITPSTGCTTNGPTFDKGAFREKLSMFVLKDIVSGMMHDETQDLDNMIDDSIMYHIRNDYKGTCYDYLTTARDRLKSPVIGNIIQEIDSATNDVSNKISETKDESITNDIKASDILKNVENYDELREMLKDKVSKKVVDDVAKVVTTNNDAPVFEDIDNKIVKKTSDDITQESLILKRCSEIVTESYIAKNPISTEEGLNKAVVEYCITEMDYLMKMIGVKK